MPIPDEGCHLIHANVDFVFNGSLSSIPLKRQLDYIVASNVIEHVPDPIDFLVQSEKFLKPGGQLHLVVPDTRYCFDYYRELTSISQVIDRFGCSNSSLGVAADVVLNTCKKGESMAWGEGALGAIQLVNSIEQSLRDFDYFGNELKKGYVDLHNWVFTPSSFRLLINDLRLLGYVDFSEAYFMDTQGFEFIVGSSVDQNRPFIDRHSYLESSRKELLAVIDQERGDINVGTIFQLSSVRRYAVYEGKRIWHFVNRTKAAAISGLVRYYKKAYSLIQKRS